MTMMVPVGISARHIHLSPDHIRMLFGEEYQLKEFKPLSQPNQFAAEETITIQGPKGRLDNVRILGPARGNTQLEISRTDAFTLGLNPPVRLSGHIDGTPGVIVIGPSGQIKIDQGVIIAARHIHFHTTDAQKWGINDKQTLKVRFGGVRGVVFENVAARVNDQYALDMHIDTDEGNAAGASTGDSAEIIVEQASKAH